MKSIIFDTGPIISLATNNLLWLLDKLQEKYKGNFYISRYVENELIKRPLEIKRFKFEALQVLFHVRKGTLKVIRQKNIDNLTSQLMELANHCFSAKKNWIKIVHMGEMEVLAASIILDADAVVIDERTARKLVEDPDELRKIMEKKLHTKIFVNKKNLNKFQNMTKNIKILRSVELVIAAYELGLLESYLPETKEPEKELLDSVLWGLKLRGCSISRREMEQIIKLERRR